MWRFEFDDFFFWHIHKTNHAVVYIGTVCSWGFLFSSLIVGRMKKISTDRILQYHHLVVPLAKKRRESSRTNRVYINESAVRFMYVWRRSLDFGKSHWNNHRGREDPSLNTMSFLQKRKVAVSVFIFHTESIFVFCWGFLSKLSIRLWQCSEQCDESL